MKKCSKCGETKEVSGFSKNRTAKDGLQHYCKVCRSEVKKIWRKNNPEKFRIYRRDYQRDWRAKEKPCLYRIKNKQNGSYYLGQTTLPLCERTHNHFSSQHHLNSPFSGLNKNDWIVEALCYGSAKQVRQLEKALLRKRVGIDPNCLNKRA